MQRGKITREMGRSFLKAWTCRTTNLLFSNEINRCFTDTRQKVGTAPEVMQPSSAYLWVRDIFII
jgi:hypothetical protein